ncbi:MAG: hypothetical protein Q4B94_08030 [Pseudomonadota bacterium]|nr:hypothetical protein [Pseudomonadota bacterium]
MSKLLVPLLASVIAAALAGGQAHAQVKKHELTVLPIVNSQSGKVEGAIALEPAGRTTHNARWRFGSNTLESAFGLSSGQSLALLCDGQGGIPSRMDRLSGSCALGAIGPASASFGNRNARVGVAVSRNQNNLPGWLAQGRYTRSDQTDFALFAEYNLGRNGVVSIAGTTAKARLITAAELPQLSGQWNSMGLSLGAGIGNFRANVFGRVVDVPGQPGRWEGFGVGLTWRTPWSGQLSVGAENIVTRGRNPFAVQGKDENGGTVPYVRYQQDL